jgi:2-iminobutanoate/2-iminopropanoate deaminase
MQDARATRKDIHPIGKKNPNLPFHPAVRAGDFIFVSGQVAKDADGNMISGTIEEETRGTIEAIRRILAEEGATLSDVVRVTTYLGDARDFGRYNRIRRALQGCRAGAHDRRGTRGHQYQNRNGRHCVQAAWRVN